MYFPFQKGMLYIAKNIDLNSSVLFPLSTKYTLKETNRRFCHGYFLNVNNLKIQLHLAPSCLKSEKINRFLIFYPIEMNFICLCSWSHSNIRTTLKQLLEDYITYIAFVLRSEHLVLQVLSLRLPVKIFFFVSA